MGLHSIQTRIVLKHHDPAVEERLYRVLTEGDYGVRRVCEGEELSECARSHRARMIACDTETLLSKAPKLSASNDPVVATVACIRVLGSSEPDEGALSLIEKYCSGTLTDSSSFEQVQRVIHVNAEEFKSLEESRVATK